MTALLSKIASDKVQGRMMGINASVQALAFSFPPILSGLVASKINPEASILISSVIVIFFGENF